MALASVQAGFRTRHITTLTSPSHARTQPARPTCTLHEDCKMDDSNIRHTMTSINLDNHKNCYILITNKQYHNFIEDLFGVQVGSEGSVPANDGKSNGRYVSCSKPSLHHRFPWEPALYKRSKRPWRSCLWRYINKLTCLNKLNYLNKLTYLSKLTYLNKLTYLS